MRSDILCSYLVSLQLRCEMYNYSDSAVSDSVSVDPLFTVSVYPQLDSPLGRLVSLCYQIHGDGNTYYNLLTTEYTSVNGLWSGITDSLNLLTRIGVQAISTTGQCHRILVDLNQCAVTIDGVSHTTDGVHLNDLVGGVLVSRHDDRVILMRFPNGGLHELQLEVECETRTMFSDGQPVSTQMLRLRIIRTLDTPFENANGLIGLSIDL